MCVCFVFCFLSSPSMGLTKKFFFFFFFPFYIVDLSAVFFFHYNKVRNVWSRPFIIWMMNRTDELIDRWGGRLASQSSTESPRPGNIYSFLFFLLSLEFLWNLILFSWNNFSVLIGQLYDLKNWDMATQYGRRRRRPFIKKILILFSFLVHVLYEMMSKNHLCGN